MSKKHIKFLFLKHIDHRVLIVKYKFINNLRIPVLYHQKIATKIFSQYLIHRMSFKNFLSLFISLSDDLFQKFLSCFLLKKVLKSILILYLPTNFHPLFYCHQPLVFSYQKTLHQTNKIIQSLFLFFKLQQNPQITFQDPQKQIFSWNLN